MGHNIHNVVFDKINDMEYNIIIDEAKRQFDDLTENIKRANDKSIYLGGLVLSFIIFLISKEINKIYSLPIMLSVASICICYSIVIGFKSKAKGIPPNSLLGEARYFNEDQTLKIRYLKYDICRIYQANIDNIGIANKIIVNKFKAQMLLAVLSAISYVFIKLF